MDTSAYLAECLHLGLFPNNGQTVTGHFLRGGPQLQNRTGNSWPAGFLLLYREHLSWVGNAYKSDQVRKSRIGAYGIEAGVNV